MTLLFYLCVESVALLFMLGANCGFNASKNRARKRGLFFLRPENAKIKGTRRVSYVVWKVKSYDALFFLSFFVLFLVIALRDEVGTDYRVYIQVYERIFRHIESATEREWLGVGFVWLCRLTQLFCGKNYLLMFALVGALTIYFLSKAIYSLSSNWCMSLYMYLCFALYYQCFNQIRQMLAMSITTYAFRFLREEKPIKFIAYAFVASLFHPSALVVLPLCFVRKWRLSFQCLAFYFIGSLLLSSVATVLIAHSGYAIYLLWDNAAESFSSGAILTLAVRIVMLIFCLSVSKETLRRDSGLLIFYHSALICSVFQILALRVHVFGRVTTYFYMVYLFLIPETMITIVRHLNRTARLCFRFGVILTLLAYHFVYYFTGAASAGYEEYRMLFFS